MAFPNNPNPGDTYTDEYGTVWVYAGPINGWYRQTVFPVNNTTYIGSDGAPGGVGNNTEVVFNDNGSLASDSGFTYNKTTDALSGGAFVPTGSTVPSNGVYLPSANNVAISTNGTGRLFVDSSGNLLVGANANSGLLGEKVTVNGAGIVTQSAPGTNRGVFGTFGSPNHVIGTFDAIPVEFRTGNTERLRITSDGKLGLGTSSAAVVLHAKGDSGYPATSGTTQTGVLRLSGGTGLYNVLDMGINESTDTAWIQSTRANSLDINYDLSLNPNGGRVGIGTGSPGQLLEINGANSPCVLIKDTTNNVIAYTFADDNAANFGSASAHPVVFRINNNEAARIDSSGRLGLGTSSPGHLLHVAGSSVTTLIEATGGTGADFLIGDGTIRYYGLRGVAGGGSLQIRNHTANTTLATFTNTGRVGIGTTSVSDKLHVSGIARVARSTDAAQYGTISIETGNVVINAEGGINTTFANGGSEKVRIDSSGRLLVGTSSARSNINNGTPLTQIETAVGSVSTGLSIINNNAGGYTSRLALGKTRGGSIGSTTVVSNDDSLGYLSYVGADGTNLIEAARIDCQVDGTPGANDMPGRLVFSTTADGSSSPTERMRIDSSGTVLIGKTSDTFGATGARIGGSGVMTLTADANELANFNRLTDDGTLLYFSQASAIEGSISVSGTTVSYNGAHLSRWSQLVGIDPYDKTTRPEILRGTVMSNLEEMCDWTCPTSGDCQDNEQLNKTEISSVDDDPNVAGVFQSWDDDDDTWVNDFYLAMTGDFVIRIAAGTTVQRGDLLCSAGDGTAKSQSDDIVRSKTIAKVTSATVSCTYPDGSYCVPCVLMAC